MNTEHEDKLLSQTVQALNESAEHIDYRTQMQLKRAREEALAQLSDAPRKKPVSRLLWLTAVPAALAVVLILPNLNKNTVNQETEMAALVQDFDIMVAGEDMEMMQDMEFYQWLAEDENFKDA